MWAHAWRGGILQNVHNVKPCRYYRMTAYGFFQPKGAPDPRERIGINPLGTLAEQCIHEKKSWEAVFVLLFCSVNIRGCFFLLEVV